MEIVILVVWVGIMIACYKVAEGKGRSGGAWALAGRFFGISALIVPALMPSTKAAFVEGSPGTWKKVERE